MINNRSVPTNRILPHIYYENVATARDWLIEVLGFTEHFHFKLPNGKLHGAMMHHGDDWIMLKDSSRLQMSPAKLGGSTQSLMMFTENVRAHYEKTVSTGATIVEELFETEYGLRQYAVKDLEGHHWTFSQHFRDVSPDSWGAILSGQTVEQD